MDIIEQNLRAVLDKDPLTPRDVKIGLNACFLLTNRRFLRRRMGDDRPTVEIDAMTEALVSKVLQEIGVSDLHPTIAELRQAWIVLDEQLGFEADPELLAHHHQVIQRLFDKSKGGA